MNPVKISTRNPNLELERPPLPVSPQDPFQGPRPDSWWTGSSPLKSGCPGLGADGKLHSLRMPNLKSCTRQQVPGLFPKHLGPHRSPLCQPQVPRRLLLAPVPPSASPAHLLLRTSGGPLYQQAPDLPARRDHSPGFRGVVSNRRRRNVLGRLAFGRELVARSRASR